jgi:protein-disulfide isomerase
MRLSIRLASVAALAALSLPVFNATAQQQVPAAPAASAQTPSAPKPAAAPMFPKPNPENFTASAPTKEAVNAFLQASWGYDENRVWQIQGILKTQVEGISRVVIYVGDKSGKMKPSGFQFLVLPDGKHLIAGDEITSFGEHPFADNRAMLQQRADGPYRGAVSKDLELVEFADFQCAHCKEAQEKMDKLAVDFPKARIVFQNYPLTRIHPASITAATYGLCVAKQGGSNAFFTYAATVYEGQAGLTSEDGMILTLNSAVTKAGLDPAKIKACSILPETVATIQASVKLAQEMNIYQTPTLMVNGREVPIGNTPYETLKQIVAYQAKVDGVAQ